MSLFIHFGKHMRASRADRIPQIFGAGNTFTAWRVSADVGKKTLDDVV
jgi:hypothetical protein